MNDAEVVELLDSAEPLVVVEAPAGCGKTFQGARYAKRSATNLQRGRALILTHTHAACAVFAKETRSARRNVEIRTIDSLLVQIAAAYHKSLDLPADPSLWARQKGAMGFQEIGARVAKLVAQQPMIASALADRYPVLIADEHQDSTTDQHELVTSLHAAGARLRIFGDPMQRIYGRPTDKAIAKDRARWETLKMAGAAGELSYPHRWSNGSLDLGMWILAAREALKARQPIDLSVKPPTAVSILFADNASLVRTAYQPSGQDRKPIDKFVNRAGNLLVLAPHNDTVQALRAFLGRRLPIWEGHSREPLGTLVSTLTQHRGNATAVSQAVVDFLASLCVGFSPSSHGDRLNSEVATGCIKATTGKPAHIQELARCILKDPGHIGVAQCLVRLAEIIDLKIDGFDNVHIDYRNEYRDAIRLADFDNPEEGLAQIHQKRSFSHPMPPKRAISNVHKAKGLECESVLVIPCDAKHFAATDYARCRLYVALSRVTRSLTIVLSRKSPSPLFRLS